MLVAESAPPHGTRSASADLVVRYITFLRLAKPVVDLPIGLMTYVRLAPTFGALPNAITRRSPRHREVARLQSYGAAGLVDAHS